uniref:Apoptosis inducing factor mitochondria associated 5 n=1 Tax=Myripristis murdjan TaxID=586833 RepID=A0A668A746_9TELE
MSHENTVFCHSQYQITAQAPSIVSNTHIYLYLYFCVCVCVCVCARVCMHAGVLSGHKVRCPWHGACFNVHTGDLEEYPGMDCLPCHRVKIQNNKVYVSYMNQKNMAKRIKSMSARVPGLNHTILLLGGGAASLICAETLRQENYGGRIIMVTRDELLPYDKTRLSKLSALSLTITFDDGSVQSYDQLLISTGCRAKGLDMPGMELGNVKMLETPEDMLEGKKVKFYMNDNVTEVRGANGKVKEVVLKSGIVIPAEVLIVGIGKCNTETAIISHFKGKHMFFSDFLLHGFICYMRTNVPGVFCGGDLASFPLVMAKKQRVSIGHWQMAQAHGRIAALNMLDRPTELNSVPFYWTVLLGKTIRYAGYGEGYTELVLKGKLEDLKFLALYIKDDEVIAAASLDYDPAVSAVAERFAAGKVITKKEAQYRVHNWLLFR